jgi:hypothetical protein
MLKLWFGLSFPMVSSGFLLNFSSIPGEKLGKSRDAGCEFARATALAAGEDGAVLGRPEPVFATAGGVGKI